MVLLLGLIKLPPLQACRSQELSRSSMFHFSRICPDQSGVQSSSAQPVMTVGSKASWSNSSSVERMPLARLQAKKDGALAPSQETPTRRFHFVLHCG
jgi:hypothetical protein